MRICYLTHDLRHNTGIGVFSRYSIEAIQKLRPAWHLGVVVEEATGHPLERAIIKMDRAGIAKNLFRLRELFKQYDIIHALDALPYGLAAAVGAWGLRKKLFMTGVGSGSIVPLFRFPDSFLARFVYGRAHQFTAISNYTARRINEKLPRLSITVINPGVDLELFTPRPGDRIFEDRLKDKKPYVFSDGALKPRKGFEVSIPAFALVAKKFPALNYVIMHNKVERGFEQVKKLKNLVRDLGLENRVFFIENASDDFRRVLYRNAELFVLMSQETPTDMEGFGLVFVQAAACGLPVVGSRGSAVEDAMRDGHNGFLVEPTDYQAVAEAIIKILSDDDLKKRLATESLRFAEFMSWERSAEQYIASYERVGK